ncbi:VWA domain-containing protein [Streptomyces sp. MP131-18]|uniref:VWA domain-containing protein n=1 Tax=Streptomyces sp. MP131-18 TaxID=1857892 RepID=UPI00097C4BCA|nr:VWA domain-containing protein [Streptomyces sp. MP131-18]ONK15828.1 VWA domain protein interacting with AAA ATPase [Streptomyces sp. MP131-18]
MGKALSNINELAGRAGKWLGPAGGTERPKATAAVAADRFDTMAWREIHAQVAVLRDLAVDLNGRYDHTEDLLSDVFLAAYKVSPRVRERAEMDPSRLVNHHVITCMTGSPAFAGLHRETSGDPYAAAMAVLAQSDALRRMLEWAKDAAERARRAKDAQEAAEQAAAAVAEALQLAAGAADEAGTVPDGAAAALTRAIETAGSADAAARQGLQETEQALAAAAAGIRAAARNATAKAAEQVGEETALMRAWGVGPGELERMPFDQRARLAERLRSGRLGRFADLIGRFRQMATGERARKVEQATGELVGITLGDDLSRVIPSELANLGVPAMRSVFAAKYAEARLMLYDSRGEQTTGKGAIIACVDCSYSMDEPGPGGVTAEAWAKACALALLDQARQGRRDFVGILFSSAERVKVYRFPASEPAGIAGVLDFAEHFFGGGTDYQAPLSAAVRLLAEEFDTDGRRRGDIVMITDGECEVTEGWMRAWNDAKHRLGFRSFGVAIGAPDAVEPGTALDALCDNLRSIEDLTDIHAAGDLFRVI